MPITAIIQFGLFLFVLMEKAATNAIIKQIIQPISQIFAPITHFKA